MYALHICDQIFNLQKECLVLIVFNFIQQRLQFFKVLTIPAIILQQQTLSNQLLQVSFQSNFQQEAFSTIGLNEIQQKNSMFAPKPRQFPNFFSRAKNCA